MKKLARVTAAVVLALVLGAAPVAAEEAPPASCPSGNLLSGLAPAASLDLRGDAAKLTDQAVAPEGALWNSPPAVVLETAAASVDYDLGAPTLLRGAFVQADANDTYGIEGSLDGQTFFPIAQVDDVFEERGHGLRGRRVALGGKVARYLRIGEGSGDGFFSLAEIAVFCTVPDPFPPPMRVEPAELSAERPPPAQRFWTDTASARFELLLAVLLLAYLGWERQGSRAARRWRLGEPGFRVIAILSFAAYFNFGAFHFDNFIHGWDLFHYYVGGKYFREIGYDRLYECVAIADAEDGLRRRVELRKHTDLRTNDLVPSSTVLEHPERCKASFTPERWQAFREDVRFFRSRERAQRWDDMMTDHGFNATPVWMIAGSIVANLVAASEGSIVLLALLDPIYLGIALWLMQRAFGWRTAAIAMVVFVANFPSRFFWTGGSFLRWDWLFYMVAAICWLKLERPRLAGAAAAYAALLRVFPGFLVVGPLLALAIGFARTRRLDPALWRFCAGGIVATVLLVLASLPIVGGPDAYRQFVGNSIKHTATPLTNYMGLRTVVAYRPSEAGRVLRDADALDPWAAWKKARLEAFAAAKPVFVVLVLGYLVALGLAVRGQPAWATAALGTTFCAVAVELTSYYYAFLLPAALIVHRREECARILLLAAAATGVIAWAPLPFLPTWWDEQYTWMSAATLIAFAAVLAVFIRGEGEEAAPSATRRSP